MLRLDRMRALVEVYPGAEREDEMVALFDYMPARQGRRRSLDRHRHARPGRRRPCRPPASGFRHRAGDCRRRGGTDQADLRRPCGLDSVAPSGLSARPRHRRDQEAQPAGDRHHPRRARHHRVGCDVRGSRGQLAGDHRHRRALHRQPTASPQPFGAPIDGYGALPDEQRRAKAAALAPFIRGLVGPTASRRSVISPTTRGCWNSSAASEHPRLAALGTSCPDHFLRTKVKPMVLDLPADAAVEDCRARLAELHEAYRADYQRLLRTPRQSRLVPPSVAPIRQSC